LGSAGEIVFVAKVITIMLFAPPLPHPPECEVDYRYLACCGDALRASHKLEALLKERERESEEMKYVQDVKISVPKLEC
jgi:hypothetical protein